MSKKMLAPHTGLAVQLRGEVTIEEVDPKTKRVLSSRSWKNNIQQNMRAALGASLAGEAAFLPSRIWLLEGTDDTMSNRNPSIVDTDIELGASGQDQLAAGFQSNDTYDIRGVLLRLKRTGTSAGTLTLEIRGDDTSLPDTADLIATSDAVPFNSLSTSYRWTLFRFATPFNAGGQRWAVLKSSGYTYSSGVTEVNMGCDQSSPAVEPGAGGIYRVAKYNGSAWSNISPDTAAAIRVLWKADNTANVFDVSDGNGGIGYVDDVAIVSKTRQSTVLVRYLGQFTAAEALTYIAGLGLSTESVSGTFYALAWADIDYDKEFVNVDVNVYWTLEVMAVLPA